MRRFFLAAFCFAFTAGPAAADTVLLRSGGEIKNVRTRVTPGRIELTDCTSTYSIADTTVKNIKPGPLNCPVPGEKKKGEGEDRPDSTQDPKNAKEKDQPNVTQDALPLWDRPWMLAVQGAVPGWSGMFRGDRWGFGFAFVGLELVGVSQLLPFVPPPVPAVLELRPVLITLALITPQPPGSPPLNSPLNTPFLIDLTARIGALRQVKDPRGGFMSAKAYQRARTEAIAGLVVVSALDIAASLWWNPVPSGKQALPSRQDDVRVTFGALPSGVGSYSAFVQISF